MTIGFQRTSTFILISTLGVGYCFLSCSDKYVINPVVNNGEDYIFVAHRIITTQTLIETGSPYVPQTLSTTCFTNKKSIQFTEDYSCNLGPCFELENTYKLLRIFNYPYALIDPSMILLFWRDAYPLRGGTYLCPDFDLASVDSIPFYAGLDSSKRLTRIGYDGSIELSMKGQTFWLAPNETYREFIRRDTVIVNELIPPDTLARPHYVLATDSLIICNYGLCPKKLLIIEPY